MQINLHPAPKGAVWASAHMQVLYNHDPAPKGAAWAKAHMQVLYHHAGIIVWIKTIMLHL